MLKGKQRAYLRSLAHNLDPIFHLGKAGMTENFEKQVDEALETRELIKINILQNCMLDAKETASYLADKLGAEFVQSIGNRFVIYRESEDNKKIDLPK